jgi:DNA-directed RNA polymerase beta' subunit
MGETSYELFGPIIEKAQRSITNISVWIKDRLKGKYGLIRGGMMKKVVDYSCRLIITGDPTVKFGYVGIAWHTILKLFEPFTLYLINKEFKHIQDLIKYEMKYDEIDNNLIKKFLHNINLEPENIVGELKNELFKLAEAVIKNKVVCYKRDPTENRDTWISSYVRVDDTGFVLKLNSLDLNKNSEQSKLDG